jgi:ComF family protein
MLAKCQGMLNRIKLLSMKFTHLLLPNQCVICHLPSEFSIALCQACILQMPFKFLSCAKCAFPLPIHHEPRICGDCLNRRWEFDQCWCLFHYEQTVQKLLIGLKFFDQLLNASLFGHLLSEKLVSWYECKPLPEVIIPVPLHPARTRKRGFNQAIEIAKAISQQTAIPIDSRCCKRTRKTLPQSELDKFSRRNNVKNAFTITTSITYQHVAIVDDIFTTGNTVDALAKALRLAGVRQIDVWCIARAE